jgi:hypothetical protein
VNTLRTRSKVQQELPQWAGAKDHDTLWSEILRSLLDMHDERMFSMIVHFIRNDLQVS